MMSLTSKALHLSALAVSLYQLRQRLEEGLAVLLSDRSAVPAFHPQLVTVEGL